MELLITTLGKSMNRNIIAKELLRMAEEIMVNPYVEEDILVSEWGYDQTNVDFYMVLKVKNKSVYLVKLEKKIFSGDNVLPTNHHKGSPFRRLVTPRRFVKIDTYEYASKWNGKPVYQTPANMGH